MASSFLPFLYQTRTLQRVSRIPVLFVATRRAYAVQSRRRPSKKDQSIPFELDEEDQELAKGIVSGNQSTITQPEAEIFKGIFEEIAEGRMPKARKRPSPAAAEPDSATKDGIDAFKKGHGETGNTELSSSIVDQVRETDFRDKFLQKYPASLRRAAETALGKFELEPQRRAALDLTDLDEEEARKLKEWERCKEDQKTEKARVMGLMKACKSDVELWEVMEEEVFSLPKKLGIVQEPKPKPSAPSKRAKKAKSTSQSDSETASSTNPDPDTATSAVDDEKRMMDIHGPLYPRYIAMGLNLFDSAFARPSPLAFKILPRVKELGLPSFVLGVTTPFYCKLAQMHWNHFGDAASTFDMLEEMRSLGLEADEEVAALLAQIRDHLHGCMWGAQGPFVMALMESAPFDTALTQRLEAAEGYVQHSLKL